MDSWTLRPWGWTDQRRETCCHRLPRPARSAKTSLPLVFLEKKESTPKFVKLFVRAVAQLIRLAETPRGIWTSLASTHFALYSSNIFFVKPMVLVILFISPCCKLGGLEVMPL
jgi:hypothetical protein